jgi:ECF transporter S component (folate family)
MNEFYGALYERLLFLEGKMREKTKRLVILSLFCALSYICVFIFRFKVSFLTFDFKDAIIAVSALLYGPLAGIIVSSAVSFLEFITVSDTGVYGLIMNFLSTVAFCLPVSLIYKHKKTATFAIIGLVFSVISVVLVMISANLLITPYYMNAPVEAVKKMILPTLLPFNLTKAIVNASLTMIIYKPIVNAVRSIGGISVQKESSYKFNKKTIVLLIASLVVFIAAILYFAFVLNGSFSVIRN